MSNPMSNPYAKQKTQVSSRAPTNPYALSGANSSLMPGATAASTSFSQAFETIEDTEHFKNATKKASDTQETESRSQQRAFDAAAQQNVDEMAHAMSDRDHHVLLQPHVLYVSTKQRGNGVLNYIRNVPYAFSRMVPDYVMSTTRCALFLSIKYHSLYPNYIHRRIAELKTDFALRILLVLVDVEDNANTLLFLNKLAVTNNLTLLLAWTEEEAARYLETFKAFDGKDASIIQKKEQTHFADQAADFLGTCKGVNKTDSAQLLMQFSSLRAVMAASMDELGLVPGMGEVKVKRLHDAFHKPFSKKAAAARKRKKQTEEELKKESAKNDEDEDKVPGDALKNDADSGNGETNRSGS